MTTVAWNAIGRRAIVTDPRCIKLFSLFIREKAGAHEAQYRQKADEIVDEDENLYKLEYALGDDTLRIELLGEEECEEDEEAQIELRWSKYIENYVKAGEHAAGLPLTPAFMKRNARRVLSRRQPPADIRTHSELECKICVNTYKMFFVENTEDWFVRLVRPPTQADTRAHNLRSRTRFHAWLQRHWSHGVQDDAERKQLAALCERFLLGKSADAKTGLSQARQCVRAGISCRHFVTAQSSSS